MTRGSTRHFKATLACLIVLGGVSCLTVSGTYATFTGQTTGAGGTATAGTLTLSDSVNGSSPACASNGSGSSGNVNLSCTALMTSSTLQYPGTSASAQVTLSDSGTVDGSTLSVFMPSCTNGTSPGATTTGGGLPCSWSDPSTTNGLELSIEEEDNSSFTENANTKCWYPVVSAGPCTQAENSFSQFFEYNGAWFTAKSLGAGPTATKPRYFLVTVSLPSDASASLQGESATFGLTWHLTT